VKRNYLFTFGKIATLFLYLFLGYYPSIQASSVQFQNKEISNASTPNLVGDSEICMVLGNTIGIYSAGGDPEDVYEWRIVKSTGEELYKRSGGEQFETIKFAFSEIGEYTVFLKIRRGTNSDFYQEQMSVRVQNGPKLSLLPDYLLCGDNPVSLTALDPNTLNIENYTITWMDANRKVLGSGNTFTATKAGYYLVDLYLQNPGGSQTCTVNGSTYVGPAIDFQITKSATKVCEGGSINISTDVPLTGEYYIRKLPNGEKVKLGTAFGINISSSELSGTGFYEVSVRIPSFDYPDCPSERKIEFEIVQAPEIEIEILEQPDACYIKNGVFQVKASSDLESLSIAELDFSKTNITKGQIFTFNDLKAKTYLVKYLANGCTSTELIQLKSENLSGTSTPYKPNWTISKENEICTVNGVNPGYVNVDFGESIENGEYRILSSTNGTVKSGAIPVSGKFEVELNSGDYLLEVIIEGCTFPTEKISILNNPQVDFSIPSAITICESFYLAPASEEELLFTLTHPGGKVESVKSGEGFNLTEGGNYSLLAKPIDPNSLLCAKKINFQATLLSPFTYRPVFIEDKCFDPIRYGIELEGINLNKVNIRWLNSDGTIVGRSRQFYPPSIGKFSLIVSPTGSGFCPAEPVEFEVIAPINSVPMDLGTGQSCTDLEAVTISLSTDLDEVLSTEWIYYDQANNREEKVEFDDLFEVQVKSSGTYEVVGYNKRGCEIGRNVISVEVTPQYTLLDLEDKYPVCTMKNSISPIDPGEFELYQWYLEDQLVSMDRLYKPDQIGNYRLIVTTKEGCEFEDSFTTYVVCDYQVVYPNAMILGNPNKDFRVLMSEGISKAELFILNRQGELIYHNLATDIPVETPILSWDGKSNGKYVPTGSYLVVIMLRNSVYGTEEKQTRTLQVL
tara:strand:+ start:30886 stop:33606 length:2721 start_codon:yes stop_codon:yes gene_type:complete